MRQGSQPVVGLVVCVLLVVSGWSMISDEGSIDETFGWCFIVLGIVGGAVNLLIVLRTRR